MSVVSNATLYLRIVNLDANLTFVLIAAATLYFVLPLFIRKNVADKDGNTIPPGPLMRLPYLPDYPERTLHGWAQKYGPLYSFYLGNQLYVVVSDANIARELLVNNGAIFSSRKQYFVKNQTILKGRAITASPYGETWRNHRKIAAQLLTPKAVAGYNDTLDYECRIMLRSLYKESQNGTAPISPAHYTGRYTLNNMLTLSFAMRTDSTSDPLIERILSMAMEFNDLTGPLSNLVDFVEPLQWIPTKTHARAAKLHSNFLEVYGGMVLSVKKRMEAGENVPHCLAKVLIEGQQQEKLDWEDVCMLSAAFALGGVHSTSGIIQWFLALIGKHPDIQARAHHELDLVVGRERWPDAEDEKSLPYVRAIIKEVLRVHAPFWNATPHSSTEDFVYNGMYIPKGAALILNCFTLHHNEQRYEDPHTFNPDRYLGDDLSSSESAHQANPMDRDHWSFGAGRRICPGINVAERILFLAISRLLWAFTIHELPTEPISLEEYEGTSGRTPKPFRVHLVPRHDRVDAAMEAEQEISRCVD
ncbi:cytochrome P450 [Irpex rosettiformis]|uniref:Cytochrome P450 n=1 Tax=Irpex rosettiformis TaxID=378272 RepID=A0ACB8U228_9APHY|nr:cytochrome P450 [Irpex rosettiformis]